MTFNASVMRADPPLIFTFGVILLLIQIFDSAMALFTAARMTPQEPYGASISYINSIPKLVAAFVCPLPIPGIGMIVDRLHARMDGEGSRK